MRVAIASPTLAAFMSGLYLATFYISNNLTLMSVRSMVALVLILTVPVTVVVACVNASLRSKKSLGCGLSVFICALYLLVALRGSFFEIEAVRHFFWQRDEVSSAIVKLFYYVLPAALLTRLFLNHVKALTVALGVMTVAALAIGVSSNTSSQPNGGEDRGSEVGGLAAARLEQTPNVYLILADSYSSFAHLKANGLDVSDFRSYLVGADFRLYDEVFSNYHPTTAAMSALLDMTHHYHLLSPKPSEVVRSGRVIIGGQNNLVNILRRHDYQIQYIHQSPHLLLQGCSADHCFGGDSYAGARMVLEQIEQAGHQDGALKQSSLEDIEEEVARLELLGTSDAKRFQYVHLYDPEHAPNHRIGKCDQATEMQQYGHRIANTNRSLKRMLEGLLEKDPTAVIVLAGDHGPFIENQCRRRFDIATLEEYRDRVGVLMAIRWPASYDGRYDGRVKTLVNVFRYVLASLAHNETAFLDTLVADDVYVVGHREVLKIIEQGSLLSKAKRYTRRAMQKEHAIRPVSR